MHWYIQRQSRDTTNRCNVSGESLTSLSALGRVGRVSSERDTYLRVSDKHIYL